MYDEFFQTDKIFVAFSISHYLPLVTISIIGVLIIFRGLSYASWEDKKRLLLLISFIPAFAILFNSGMRICESHFNIKEDLPLHICRFVALIAPLVIWKMNRFWMGILYFWILAGTLNANITPDLTYDFPHWNYFTYWASHSFLIILPIYYVVVLKEKINLKDLRNAFLMANVFLLFTLSVNVILGSNYMYSREKPAVASLLDFLGPWPIYLISGQLLALTLFFILYLPFFIQKK
jgi:hypothetical integral membrane protein (TIGR02206 family)